MQIRQIQVVSDIVQDRLVLRVATSGNEEFRVFLTRRFLRELWPHLTAMLNGHLKATARPAETPLPGGEPPSFEQAFREENPIYPLGATPLLASEAKLDTAGDGQVNLLLREGRERSLNLNLNADLMQALCAMLRAASEKAAWNLALDYSPPSADEPRLNPPASKPGLLH